MSELVIRISDSNMVRVEVDGEPIGLIQDLVVRASMGRPVPSVEVRFPDATVIQASSTMPEAHRGYLELLRRIPCVALAADPEPSATDSPLVQYFLGTGKDHEDRTLHAVMSKDDSWLERNDDYVQWILPTRRQSRYCPNSPVLTDADLKEFSGRRDLREAYLFGVDRMTRFLGLDQMCPSWVRWKDHNHKRVSRLIQSLSDLGFKERAERVLAQAVRIDAANKGSIDPDVVGFWYKACGR